MIPQLDTAPGLSNPEQSYLEKLKLQGFTGDIATGYADRLSVATDNSIYQQLPSAILFPKSVADIILATSLAGEKPFQELVFTPRGGGTGTNGQSLNRGVVVDLSRYMTRILEINLQEGWVRAEAGVVKDQLNAWLKAYGYFFAPELSTSNRATLGGMVNTDASGQGSRVYGKTSDHVLGIRAVLLSGEMIDTRPMPVAEAQKMAGAQHHEGRIYQTVMGSCRGNRQLIEEKFPKLNRFLTGYDLRHVFSDDLKTFDLTRLLCGSEGSLAFVAEVKLNILPVPKVRHLVNIKYDSFDSALRSAPVLMEAKALSVETVDSKVLDLARQDIVWHSVSDLIQDVTEQSIQGLNLVEFAGDDPDLISHQVRQLCLKLDSLMGKKHAGIIGYQCCTELNQVERIYAMRKKAVGLLGNAQGAAKPIPFVEDTAVPPEHLADYITKFRALLDQHGLEYGMFGHVDAGVLHVRPALDITCPEQQRLIQTISDQVVELTASYGGLLWGEHGKGFRSAYSEAFFGAILFTELRRIKACFDPLNRLNPGKICTPLATKYQLLPVSSPTRGDADRQIPVNIRNAWRGTMECNGNGLCFNFDVNSTMCPSMKVTRNRIHSPKGRAALTREWLRLLAEQGADPDAIEHELYAQRPSLRRLIERTRNSWRARQGEYDFSHEVKDAMAGCLACKACSTQCPVKIDVPAFRSRFLQLYYSRYLRPVSDHLVANIEKILLLMAKAPDLFNGFMRLPVTETLSRRIFGMANMPPLSSPTLKQQLTGHFPAFTTIEQLKAMPEAQRRQHVLVVQDPFTSFYEAPLVTDLFRLITLLGYRPVLLPFTPNGKPQQVKGFLKRFIQTAIRSADFLNKVAELGLPMIGTDPALVLCYRDEYPVLLGDRRGDFQVWLAHEWLELVTQKRGCQTETGDCWYLFSHCSETTALPDSGQQWQKIFSRFGARLEVVNTGCCGMAGTYGHETRNLANSQAIFLQSWSVQLQDRPTERCLATGYSCRSQAKRMAGKQLRHPIQALLNILS